MITSVETWDIAVAYYTLFSRGIAIGRDQWHRAKRTADRVIP